jgi:tripartite ATP-independent transporter DctM subunit
MELFFLLILVLLMAGALGSGFPVAFSLPGSAIISVGLAALTGWLVTGSPDAYFYQGGPSEWLNAGVTNFRGVYWEVERDTLIAIPLFVFMGIMLQRSRIAEDLLVTMAQLFGPVRGGLGMSVVFVGALLAATTGIVGATVVAMGLISLPAMLRHKYSHPLATGTIAASGTLGQIIPPSIVLIILADQLASATDQASTARKALYKASTGELSMPSAFDVTSTSAGEMFLGALLPGLVLVGVYIVFIAVYAFFKPSVAPAIPFEGNYDRRFALRVVMALVPPLALIFIVLGSIIMGIATVNQAGAIGASGAMIMGSYRLREGHSRAYWPAILALVSVFVIITTTQVHPLNIKKIVSNADMVWLVIALMAVAGLLMALFWSGVRAYRIDDTLRGVMIETAKTTSLVFIILLGAAMLTAAFRGFGGEVLVKDFLTSLPGGFWGQFVIVMAVIFVLGFFLDFIEIAVVVVPIVAPILLADPSANVTAVWLGVMIGLNIQTSFLTPPFGFALFYLRGVAPKAVKTISMYKGVIPFIIMQLLALVIVAYSPRLVNYLPTRLSLTGETAPPPINPKLQHCIEKFVFTQYDSRGAEIRSAITQVSALDLKALPNKLQKSLKSSFKDASKTFSMRDDIATAVTAIDAASPSYRPLHRQVRQVESAITRLQQRQKNLTTDLRQLTGDDAPQRKAVLEDSLKHLQEEQKALEATIPAEWKERNKTYANLIKAEKKARAVYRRNVDGAYEPVQLAVKTISAAEDLAKLQPRIEGVREVINGQELAAAAEHIATLLPEVGAVAGARGIRSKLSNVRRALRGRTPDKAKALKRLDTAMKTYREELEWRLKAKAAVLGGLSTYEQAIRNTVGLRKQSKLPATQAVEVAACMAHHRDISLHF